MSGADDVAEGSNFEGEEGLAADGLAIQMTVSSCWLSLKEASLTVGALCRHLPIPGKCMQESAHNARMH